MKKVMIYNKSDGSFVACYVKSENNQWIRFAGDVEIESIEESVLYGTVFGGVASKERFFFIIEI